MTCYFFPGCGWYLTDLNCTVMCHRMVVRHQRSVWSKTHRRIISASWSVDMFLITSRCVHPDHLHTFHLLIDILWTFDCKNKKWLDDHTHNVLVWVRTWVVGWSWIQKWVGFRFWGSKNIKKNVKKHPPNNGSWGINRVRDGPPHLARPPPQNCRTDTETSRRGGPGLEQPWGVAGGGPDTLIISSVFDPPPILNPPLIFHVGDRK